MFSAQQVLQKLKRLQLDRPALQEPLLNKIGKDKVSLFSPAAVLIPFSITENGFEILFTKRANSLRQHSGEISFPGGKMDPEDTSLVATALRETNEEIGLKPDAIELFGCLLQVPTISKYLVNVYVGQYDASCEVSLNPCEIDEILIFPLSILQNPTIHHTEKREVYGNLSHVDYYTLHVEDYPDLELQFQPRDSEYTIWGVTGYMLNRLLFFLS